MDAGPSQMSPHWIDDIDFPQYPGGGYVYRIGSQPGDFPDPPRKQGGESTQSHAQVYYPSSGRPVPPDTSLCPRLTLRVNAFSVGDQDGDQGLTPGTGTFMLIDHTTDPTGANGPRRVGFRSFRSTSHFIAYGQGGLPRIDEE